MPAALLLDQLSKWAAVGALPFREPVPVLGDIVRLTYIHNYGAAFGIEFGGPWLHTGVAVAALGVLAWMFWGLPETARLQRTALAMVLGGALGNIVDRVRLGYVIDFFDVGVAPGWRWPVFNVADSFVSVGIVVLAVCYARQGSDEEHAADTPAPSAAADTDSGPAATGR